MTGYALATALAAPVDDGMMFADAARPARQSAPFIEPSTVSCDAVAACTVVMRPCLMPNFSLMTFTIGARPLVVHEAQEITFISVLYSSVLTPTTMVGVSASFAGAEMITFLAPASVMCGRHFGVSVKAPVDSQMYSAPTDFQGISAGSRVPESVTLRPLMMSELPSSPTSHEPLKRPCTVSYAGAVPKGVSDWTSLENWKEPKTSKSYSVEFKNGVGMKLTRFEWRFAWKHGGSYQGT